MICNTAESFVKICEYRGSCTVENEEAISSLPKVKNESECGNQGEGFVRMSLAVPDEMFEEATQNLKDVMKDWS